MWGLEEWGGEEEAIDQVSLKATQLCQPCCLCQPFPQLPAPGWVPAAGLVCLGNCPASWRVARIPGSAPVPLQSLPYLCLPPAPLPADACDAAHREWGRCLFSPDLKDASPKLCMAMMRICGIAMALPSAPHLGTALLHQTGVQIVSPSLMQTQGAAQVPRWAMKPTSQHEESKRRASPGPASTGAGRRPGHRSCSWPWGCTWSLAPPGLVPCRECPCCPVTMQVPLRNTGHDPGVGQGTAGVKPSPDGAHPRRDGTGVDALCSWCSSPKPTLLSDTSLGSARRVRADFKLQIG